VTDDIARAGGGLRVLGRGLAACAVVAAVGAPAADRAAAAPEPAAPRPRAQKTYTLPQLPGSVNFNDKGRLTVKQFHDFITANATKPDLELGAGYSKIVWRRGKSSEISTIQLAIYADKRAIEIDSAAFATPGRGRVLAAIDNVGDDEDALLQLPRGWRVYWVVEKVGASLPSAGHLRSFFVVHERPNPNNQNGPVFTVRFAPEFLLCKHGTAYDRAAADFKDKDCERKAADSTAEDMAALTGDGAEGARQRPTPPSGAVVRFRPFFNLPGRGRPPVNFSPPWVTCDLGCCTLGP